MFTTVDSICNAGFERFYTISQLWNSPKMIPDVCGIYLIINPTASTPVFLPVGSGGSHKGKNPNVPLSLLQERWIAECRVLNVGKAGGAGYQTTLRKRLGNYLAFGQGKPRAHWGGRLIWQLEQHPELLVAWKTMRTEDPRLAEEQIIEEIRVYYGRRPFANLVG